MGKILRKRKKDEKPVFIDITAPPKDEFEDWGKIPCKHLNCPRCHGTGFTILGAMCVHENKCDCEQCAKAER